LKENFNEIRIAAHFITHCAICFTAFFHVLLAPVLGYLQMHKSICEAKLHGCGGVRSGASDQAPLGDRFTIVVPSVPPLASPYT
jgi:hypothetical protein